MDKYTGAMKTHKATHDVMFADRLAGNFTTKAHGHDARDDRFIMPHAAFLRVRKIIKGGSDGGPGAGMVMPDMSIGAVPYYS